MKRIFLALTALLMVFNCLASPSVSGVEYVEQRPEAIRAVKENGVGAIFGFMGPDGGIRNMRVTGFESASAGGGLVVKLERADNAILLDFDSDENFVFEPIQDSVGDATDLSVSEIGEASPMGLSVGIGPALMSGLSAGLIVSTGYHVKVQKAFARIAELEKQMGQDFQRVQEARIGLYGQAVIAFRNNSRVDGVDSRIQGLPTLSEIESRTRHVNARAIDALGPVKFISKDKDFLRQAGEIQTVLGAVRPRDDLERTFHKISRAALIAADQSSFLANTEDAAFLLAIARESANVLVGLDPFVGTARSIFEAVSGTNIVTGEALTDFERTMAVLGVLSGGYALKATGVFRWIRALAKKVAPATVGTLRAGERAVRGAGHGIELVGEAAHARKINFRSSRDPNWGLTPRHLKKHFFGESKYALKNIDPQGNPDTWMQNLVDLTQRPSSRTLDSGVIEVHGVFDRADGMGRFRMGVRLWQNEDGTFELVTVLTKQTGEWSP